MPCLVCAAPNVIEAIDFGPQPVSSSFLPERDASAPICSLALGRCERCQIIQLMKPVPHTQLVPPYDWLVAREPEEHLDTVVEKIVALPGIHPGAVIGGLTSKDDSTVERFARRGFTNTWRIRLKEDLGLTDPCANIETVQALTEPGRMTAIADRLGAADVLIVRHIAEHAEQPATFMSGLSALVRPGGVLMLEIPDCSDSLRIGEFTMLWEEHSLYMTPATFEPLCTLGGFETVDTTVYPRPFENSIVQLSRKIAAPGPLRMGLLPAEEAGRLPAYARQFAPTKASVRRILENARTTIGPIALFGAGHLACTFVNLMEVADLIDFVADDTPQKQGKFLPGSRLPICPSGMLGERGVRLCLLAVSIGSEAGILSRYERAIESRVIRFASIFRSSTRSLFKQLTEISE